MQKNMLGMTKDSLRDVDTQLELLIGEPPLSAAERIALAQVYATRALTYATLRQAEVISTIG